MELTKAMLQRDVGALVKRIARSEFKKQAKDTPAAELGQLSYRSSNQKGNETVCERFVQRDILSYSLQLKTLHLDREFVFWHPSATARDPKSKNNPDDKAGSIDGEPLTSDQDREDSRSRNESNSPSRKSHQSDTPLTPGGHCDTREFVTKYADESDSAPRKTSTGRNRGGIKPRTDLPEPERWDTWSRIPPEEEFPEHQKGWSSNYDTSEHQRMDYKEREAGVPRQKTNFLAHDQRRGQEVDSDREQETPSYEHDEERQASVAELT